MLTQKQPNSVSLSATATIPSPIASVGPVLPFPNREAAVHNISERSCSYRPAGQASAVATQQGSTVLTHRFEAQFR